ncbi:unnamed protein product, partial [Rotaria magnacalcarata]
MNIGSSSSLNPSPGPITTSNVGNNGPSFAAIGNQTSNNSSTNTNQSASNANNAP